MKVVRMVKLVTPHVMYGKVIVSAYGAMAHILLGSESEASKFIDTAGEEIYDHNDHKAITLKVKELLEAVIPPTEINASNIAALESGAYSAAFKAQPPPFEERWANFRRVMDSWRVEESRGLTGVYR